MNMMSVASLASVWQNVVPSFRPSPESSGNREGFCGALSE
jgi:hypothetical protein